MQVISRPLKTGRQLERKLQGCLISCENNSESYHPLQVCRDKMLFTNCFQSCTGANFPQTQIYEYILEQQILTADAGVSLALEPSEGEFPGLFKSSMSKSDVRDSNWPNHAIESYSTQGKMQSNQRYLCSAVS